MKEQEMSEKELEKKIKQEEQEKQESREKFLLKAYEYSRYDFFVTGQLNWRNII